VWQRLIFPFLVFFFCCNKGSNAQDSDLIFKNITISDGLSESIVLAIAQDSLGFMWFATPEALNRYDGSEFKIFPKSFDYKTDLQDFKTGKLRVFGNKLWMVTKGGKLEVMNLENERFSQLTHFGNSSEIIPEVRSILVENNNRIWIGTENQGLFLVDSTIKILSHYHTDAPRSFKLISNQINDIFKDSMGSIWVSTDQGVNKIEDQVIFTHLEGIDGTVIIEDLSSRLLIGTRKNGVFLTDLKNQKFIQLSGMNRKIDFPPDLTVTSLYFDSNLRLWIGSYGDGLYILNNRDYALTHYLPDRNLKHSVASKDLMTILAGENEGIWIGTDGGGISFFDESNLSFTNLVNVNSSASIPIEQVTAITSSGDSAVWYGTSTSGFVKYHAYSQTAEAFSLKDLIQPGEKPTNVDRIRAMSIDVSGDLWIASEGLGTILYEVTNRKLKDWSNKNSSEPTAGLFSAYVPNCFLQEGDSSMWAGTRSGLLLYHKEMGMVKKFSPNHLGEISSLVRINESILAVGFKESGLALFNILTGEFSPIASDFIAKNFEKLEVSSLYYLNDWLWVGTVGKGLMVTHLKTGQTKVFTIKDGLPSNLIYGILEEDSRKIWVSSNTGIFKLTYKKLGIELEIDRINLYNQRNGFLGNEFKSGAFHKDQFGTLYFGGIRGINFFSPNPLEERLHEPTVIISDLRIGNIPYVGEKSIPYTKYLSLNHAQNSIEFKYSALSFLIQGNHNYSYKLEGHDEAWIDAGTRKYAAYTNLEPGDYVFKVRLTNSDPQAESISSLAFSIASPYWKTAWFRILVGLMVLGIFYLIYKIRINQLMEVQNVKHNISAELHDDLGSRLTTLHLISAISKPKFENDQRVTGLLETIDKEISASSEALDEIVWNIQVSDEGLNEVTANIRRYVSETLESYGIDYSITATEDFGSKEMNMQKRREIFLICKELVNNIRKHAEASNLEMHLGQEQDMFLIRIRDDGKGFDPEKETTRNGLANIKERVRKWNGKILITSEMGKGSKFEIWIPFDKKHFLRKLIAENAAFFSKYPQKWGLR
jgi:ligand-binding sensor domain-containing protein/signal transduction histidine kinase